jgi:hypothetical protein
MRGKRGHQQKTDCHEYEKTFRHDLASNKSFEKISGYGGCFVDYIPPRLPQGIKIHTKQVKIGIN